MASKQLYELDSVTLPLKDDDLVLVSLKSVAEKANFSRKATIANIASKVQENVSTEIDNAKYEIQLESDKRYAAKGDVYAKADVDAFIAAVNPTINYMTRAELEETYAEKWLLEQNVLQLSADIKDTSYSKTVIDEKFSTLSDNFPSRDNVYTSAEVDVKINELSDVYAKKADVYTSTEVDVKINELSNEYAKKQDVYTLTEVDEALATVDVKINELSDVYAKKFEIKTFNNDSTDIIAENCVINYVSMSERNSLTVTLPAKDENNITEFYIIVDNTKHTDNVQLVITPQDEMKLVSANEQCFDDVPASKVGYLHFKQVSNDQLLKVDRVDLAIIDTTNAG